MKPSEPVDTGQHDMFRSRLDQIIHMGHEKVVLAGKIDWQFLSDKCGENYTDKPGHPALPTPPVDGRAHILKYADNLSDEELCARWVENPYYQYFCGEEFFCHELPFEAVLDDPVAPAHGRGQDRCPVAGKPVSGGQAGAAKPADFASVIVDTTVAEKNVAYPTDAKLINKARVRLVKMARAHGLTLRQSYVRVGKKALIQHQRYAHAKQFKRARKQLNKLKTLLGRTSRDIERQIKGNDDLQETFRAELWKAGQGENSAPTRRHSQKDLLPARA